jgi:selenium metabolism protein YedF
MDTVIVLHGESMGSGDAGLGAKLSASFLRTLTTLEPRPSALVFYNGAVNLLGPGSAVLDSLHELDNAGVELLACVTCLEFYALRERIQVGRVSNMREIAGRLLQADKVITL